MAEFLAATAASAGLDVEFQDALPERRNVVIRYAPAEKPQQTLLLAPHMDTVGSIDGSDEIFTPRLEDGRLWGRGACDTKGSIAAMLTALIELSAQPDRPRRTQILFAGLIDEETCQRGARAFVKSGVRADFGIVGEPTRLRVVTAHKGDVWARIQTRGKAAHGACPDKGRNAVRLMARAVELLEGEYSAGLRKRRPHPLLGHATINVGVIRGGMQPNIVPDQCEIEIDRRTLPGETDDAVRREIIAFLAKRGVRATIEDVKGVPEPALETDPRLPWVRSLLKTAGRKEAEGVHYFCDAAVLAAGGIPCAVFGPGDIAQAHTAREWISIASLDRGAALLKRFLQEQP